MTNKFQLSTRLMTMIVRQKNRQQPENPAAELLDNNKDDFGSQRVFFFTVNAAEKQTTTIIFLNICYRLYIHQQIVKIIKSRANG